jgi:hypothetical protein
VRFDKRPKLHDDRNDSSEHLEKKHSHNQQRIPSVLVLPFRVLRGLHSTDPKEIHAPNGPTHFHNAIQSVACPLSANTQQALFLVHKREHHLNASNDSSKPLKQIWCFFLPKERRERVNHHSPCKQVHGDFYSLIKFISNQKKNNKNKS